MELVKIANYYAVRRKFIFWHQYLDLHHFRTYMWITWRFKYEMRFSNCLCESKEEAKNALNFLNCNDEILKE